MYACGFAAMVADGWCPNSVRLQFPICLKESNSALDPTQQQYLDNPSSYPGWKGQILAHVAAPSAPEIHKTKPVFDDGKCD